MKKFLLLLIAITVMFTVSASAAAKPASEKTAEVVDPFKVSFDKDNNIVIENFSSDDTVCKRLWLITPSTANSNKFKGDESVYALMDDRSLKKVGKYSEIFSTKGINLAKTPIDKLQENYYWIRLSGKMPKGTGLIQINVVSENLKGERTTNSIQIHASDK